MAEFLQANESLLIGALITVILICLIMIFRVIPQRRRKRAAATSPDPGSRTDLLFTSYLQNKAKELRSEIRQIRQMTNAYENGKGYEFRFQNLTGRFSRSGPFQIDEMLVHFHSLTDHPYAPQIARALMDANHEIVTAETRLQALEIDFKAQYLLIIQSFGRNIVRLSQLYDHLKRPGKRNRPKPELQGFEESYKEVFDQWSKSGRGESLKTVRDELVVAILAVNEKHPENRYAKQIEGLALKCEEAYEAIGKCDRRAMAEMRNLGNALKKACRVIDRVLAPAEFSRSGLLAGDPQSQTIASTTKAEQAAVPKWPPSPTEITKPTQQPPSKTATARNKGMSVLARDTLEKLNIDPSTLDPIHPTDSSDSSQIKGKPPKKSSGRKKAWTPQRRASVITSVILGIAVIAIGGIYGWRYIQSGNELPSAHTGHTLPDPHPDDRVESHGHHASLLKPLLDSLYKPHLAGALASVRTRLDSIDADHPERDSLQAAHDSLQTLVANTPKAPPPAAYGIDVSHHQNEIDWAAVATDTSEGQRLHFGIMKASQGTKADPRFPENWKAAGQHLDAIGAYHFFSFQVSPKAQAETFIKTVTLRRGHIRPIVDVERNCNDEARDPQCLPTGGLSDDELVARVRAFLSVVEEHCQCKAIIYTGRYYYNKYLKGNFPENDFWLAEYSKNNSIDHVLQTHSDPPETEVPVMWQFTSKGAIDGINGHVDLDYLPGMYLERVLIH